MKYEAVLSFFLTMQVLHHPISALTGGGSFAATSSGPTLPTTADNPTLNVKDSDGKRRRIKKKKRIKRNSTEINQSTLDESGESVESTEPSVEETPTLENVDKDDNIPKPQVRRKKRKVKGARRFPESTMSTQNRKFHDGVEVKGSAAESKSDDLKPDESRPGMSTRKKKVKRTRRKKKQVESTGQPEAEPSLEREEGKNKESASSLPSSSNVSGRAEKMAGVVKKKRRRRKHDGSIPSDGDKTERVKDEIDFPTNSETKINAVNRERYELNEARKTESMSAGTRSKIWGVASENPAIKTKQKRADAVKREANIAIGNGRIRSELSTYNKVSSRPDTGPDGEVIAPEHDNGGADDLEGYSEQTTANESFPIRYPNTSAEMQSPQHLLLDDEKRETATIVDSIPETAQNTRDADEDEAGSHDSVFVSMPSFTQSNKDYAREPVVRSGMVSDDATSTTENLSNTSIGKANATTQCSMEGTALSGTDAPVCATGTTQNAEDDLPSNNSTESPGSGFANEGKAFSANETLESINGDRSGNTTSVESIESIEIPIKAHNLTKEEEYGEQPKGSDHVLGAISSVERSTRSGHLLSSLEQRNSSVFNEASTGLGNFTSTSIVEPTQEQETSSEAVTAKRKSRKRFKKTRREARPETRKFKREDVASCEDEDTDMHISIVTWNLGEESPGEDDAKFIRRFQKCGTDQNGSDFVLISGQECENIKPRRTEGHRSREFRRLMIKMLGKNCVPIAMHLLGGIQFGLSCRRSVLQDLEHVSVADVTCGIGNVFHNKGAIGAFVQVKARNENASPNERRSKSLKMLFVTAHMAAHVKHFDARDSDFWRIVSELEAQAPEKFLRRRGSEESSGRALLDAMDRIFFCGDLNYRIDLPREVVEHTIQQMTDIEQCRGREEDIDNLRSSLLRHDQLLSSMADRRAFLSLAEGKIRFAPTFKFDKGSQEYDTSHKQRIPAWTDRVLFKPFGTRILEYNSVPSSHHSDHRPVHATFRVNSRGRVLPKLQKKTTVQRRKRKLSKPKRFDE